MRTRGSAILAKPGARPGETYVGFVHDPAWQRWHQAAVRLVADATVVDQLLEHGAAPDLAAAAELANAAALLTTRLETLTTRIGTAHRDKLDEPALEQLRAAVVQLHTAAETLAALPTALHPSHGDRPA